MLKCGGCQRSLGTGVNLRCKKCKEVFYCDARCQKVAWPVHKRSCKLVTDKLQSDRLVLKTLKELYVVNDFHGVLSMKESAMTIAAKLQENWHGHTQHVDYVAVQDHVSRVYTILGASMRSMGQYREAYEMYMLAKAALDAIDDPFHISKSAVFIAIVQVLMDLNRTEEALEINRAIVARWQNSTMHLQMIAHSGLASCLTKIGKYEEASESYQKQVDMAIALGDKIEEAGALDGFANNLMLLGQNERAYELFERCRALALNHVEVHESFSLRVIVGMASSLWNQVCCCDAVTFFDTGFICRRPRLPILDRTHSAAGASRTIPYPVSSGTCHDTQSGTGSCGCEYSACKSRTSPGSPMARILSFISQKAPTPC